MSILFINKDEMFTSNIIQSSSKTGAGVLKKKMEFKLCELRNYR